MLAESRNLDAARRFLKCAIASNGVLDRIRIDKSGASLVGIETPLMIRKGQIPANGASTFQVFAELAAQF